MTTLDDLYKDLADLEAQRGEVLAVRALIRQEAAQLAEAFTGTGTRPNVEPVAVAAAQSAQALRALDLEIKSVRAGIIQERMDRGHKPDCPKGTISAWYPFLDSGQTKEGGME